jgi:hypothetical protein
MRVLHAKDVWKKAALRAYWQNWRTCHCTFTCGRSSWRKYLSGKVLYEAVDSWEDDLNHWNCLSPCKYSRSKLLPKYLEFQIVEMNSVIK